MANRRLEPKGTKTILCVCRSRTLTFVRPNDRPTASFHVQGVCVCAVRMRRTITGIGQSEQWTVEHMFESLAVHLEFEWLTSFVVGTNSKCFWLYGVGDAENYTREQPREREHPSTTAFRWQITNERNEIHTTEWSTGKRTTFQRCVCVSCVMNIRVYLSLSLSRWLTGYPLKFMAVGMNEWRIRISCGRPMSCKMQSNALRHARTTRIERIRDENHKMIWGNVWRIIYDVPVSVVNTKTCAINYKVFSIIFDLGNCKRNAKYIQTESVCQRETADASIYRNICRAASCICCDVRVCDIFLLPIPIHIYSIYLCRLPHPTSSDHYLSLQLRDAIFSNLMDCGN